MERNIDTKKTNKQKKKTKKKKKKKKTVPRVLFVIA